MNGTCHCETWLVGLDIRRKCKKKEWVNGCCLVQKRKRNSGDLDGGCQSGLIIVFIILVHMELIVHQVSLLRIDNC